MPRFRLLVLACAALAACATPQQSCLNGALKDLRVIEALIAETEQNLTRGYALEQRPGIETGIDLCLSPDDPFTFCTSQRLTPTEKPVAINTTEERAKLAALQAKRAELTSRAAREQAACLARFPQ